MPLDRRIALKRLDMGKQADIPALENELAMMKMSEHPNIGEQLKPLTLDPEPNRLGPGR